MLKNNEKGSTLVMVLLLVVIITILGASLFTMNMSASKQFTNKEHQVQARHLAEMGVLHYQAAVDEKVESYNKSFEPVYSKDKDGGSYLNIEASKEKYIRKLCQHVHLGTLNSEGTETGAYTVRDVEENKVDCRSLSFDLEELVIEVESTGAANGQSKVIEAEVTITPKGTDGGGSGGNPEGDQVPGRIPQKPEYPEGNWINKMPVPTLDHIVNSDPVKVTDALTNQNPFETSAFVEVGGFDMQKKSNWTFKDHLLVTGNVEMKTAGSNLSTLTVEKDLYIGGAFHTENHNKVHVVGDLMIMGDVKVGTYSEITVNGNALFDDKISEVEPHAKITIHQNAYFKQPLGTVKNEAEVCVKGGVFLWKNDSWAPYLPDDEGYEGFSKSCLGTSAVEPTESFSWAVEPDVNAEYK